MKKFLYKIQDELGIHARPAGVLVKKVGEFESKVILTNLKNQKSTDADKIFGVMSLGIKCGDEVEISIDGSDEDVAYPELKAFFEENL